MPLEPLTETVLQPPRLDALPPSASAAPEIHGTLRSGRRLRATTGRWTGSESHSYRWARCDASGGACRPIAGASHATYRVTEQDAGRRLRVTVTATSRWGAAAARSRATAIVRAQAGPTTIQGTSRGDTLIGTAGSDVIFGGAGDDRLTGRGGADRLYGGRGRDELDGGPGRDRLNGGAGVDRAMRSSLDRARSVEVAAGRPTFVK